MKKNSFLKMMLLFAGAVFTILITTFAVYPLLQYLLHVDVNTGREAFLSPTPLPAEAPEDVLVTAIYQQEDNSSYIDAIYIEVFHPGTGAAFYMEVPADTKVELSADLYKKLQTYSPELPQYLKLSKMGEGFSEEYRYFGCNRILSEVLGETIHHYICADKVTVEKWLEAVYKEKDNTRFFRIYSDWVTDSRADISADGRMVYYESYKEIVPAEIELAPGERNVGSYTVSKTQAKKRLKEYLISPVG